MKRRSPGLATIDDDTTKQRLRNEGAEPIDNGPGAFAEMMRVESTRCAERGSCRLATE